MAFCTKCGAAIEENAKFCVACGASVEVSEPEAPVEPEAPETAESAETAASTETTTSAENAASTETTTSAENTASAAQAPSLSFGFFTNGESSFKKLWATKNISDAVKGIPDTTDETDAQNEDDVKNNKVFAILAYIGILFLVPLFAAKNSKFALYHAKQGITLWVFSVIYSIASSILSAILIWIPIVGWALALVLWAVSLLFLAGTIFGIYNAATGKAKEIPFIGHITFIK